MDNPQEEYLNLIERYFLKKLSKKELRDFDQKIQSDPDFAKEVSLYHSIRKASTIPSRQKVDEAHQAYKQKIKRQNWLLGTLLILFLSIAAYYFYESKKEVPTFDIPQQKSIPIAKNADSELLLNQFWQNEKEGIGGASGTIDWEEYFKNKNFSLALKKLEKDIAQQKIEQPKLFYFAGILNLYLKEGSNSKALNYLIRSKGFSNDTEYDYSKHLIIAYAENKAFGQARLLLDQFPRYKAYIPEYLLRDIIDSNQ